MNTTRAITYSIISERTFSLVRKPDRLKCLRCGVPVKLGDLVKRKYSLHGVTFEHVSCMEEDASKPKLIIFVNGFRTLVTRENLKGIHGEKPIVSTSEPNDKLRWRVLHIDKSS